MPSTAELFDDEIIKDHKVVTDALAQYYQRFFPFKYVYRWLNHSLTPSPDMTNRELAFTIDPGDRYVRYLSYSSAEAFKKDVLRLMPTRFEVGPIYSANPRDRKIISKNQFKPIAKELVFDLDLTDYDDVRTCCSDKKICVLCWKFITVSIAILDVALREDFGFEHILWVYSGRRGAHAWVCDKRARELDDHQRRAVAAYLRVVGKGSQGRMLEVKRPFHPHVSRSFKTLVPCFADSILPEQDPWKTPERAERLLQRIPDKALRESLKKKWANGEVSSADRWADIDEMAEKGISKTLNVNALLESKKDIILEYVYPRLDIAVSNHLNHLLKSPFCVHPGTGRVCVPIENPDTFDPTMVPTLDHLLNELHEYDAHNVISSNKIRDYEKTSLKGYIDYFFSFVDNLLKDEQQRAKREREDEPADLSF